MRHFPGVSLISVISYQPLYSWENLPDRLWDAIRTETTRNPREKEAEQEQGQGHELKAQDDKGEANDEK